MIIKSFASRIALITILGCLIIAGPTSLVLAQGGPDQTKVSPEEQSLVNAIVSASGAAAKLKTAAQLIKAHPKTAIRPRVASNLAHEVDMVKDAAQKITLAQEYQKIFTEPSEQDLILPVLIDGYADAGRADEAFSTGATFLAGQPESVSVLARLTLMGTDSARKRNNKFVEPSLKYGAKAIELIEANKKPADMDDTGWNYYKGLLGTLYNSMGVLNLTKGNLADAKGAFVKGTQAAPTDPFNYLMLGGVLYEEYSDAAKRYQAMPAGPAKDAELPKALAVMDRMIDAHAHMIALSEGNAILQGARQQTLEDLERYYKYRHNNSTEGMQQLIDKYKVASK